MELKLEGLSIDEANLILGALDKLPYGTVVRLINKLKSQFESQLAVNPDLEIVE